MLSLAGPIAEVRAYAMTSGVHRMETEDMVVAAVRFATVRSAPSTPPPQPIGLCRAIESSARRRRLAVGSDLSVAHNDGRVTENWKTAYAGGPVLTRWRSERLASRGDRGFPRCARPKTRAVISDASA